MIAIMPLLINLALVYFDLKIKSVFSSFSLATLAVFSFPHFILSCFDEKFSEATYQYVTLHATLFFVALIFIRLLLTNSLMVRKNNDIFDDDANKIEIQFRISFILLCLFLVLSFSTFDFSLSKAMSYSWNDFRESSSNLSLLGSFLLYSGSSVFLLSFKTKSKFGWLAIIFALIYIVMILKTRNFLVAIFAPMIIYFLIYTRWTVKKFVVGVLLGATFMTLYSGARNIRHLGSIDDIGTISKIEFKVDSGEFELIETLYYFVEKGGVKLDYNNVTLIRLLTIPFPSSIIPLDKPKELSHILWDQKTGLTNVSGSLHPTVIGDSILNSFYIGSLLYGFLYGMLFLVLDRVITYSNSRILFFGLFCTVAFYIARGAVYNGVVILLVSSFFILFFGFLFSRVRFNINVR